MVYIVPLVIVFSITLFIGTPTATIAAAAEDNDNHVKLLNDFDCEFLHALLSKER